MTFEELKNWLLELERVGNRPERETIAAEYPQFAELLQQFYDSTDRDFQDEQTVSVDQNTTQKVEVDSSVISGPFQQATATFDTRPEDDNVKHRKFIGNYRLLQIIGSGGMGEVWSGIQEQPIRRRVAIKLIKTGMDSKEVVARFDAERQALAMMDHQNIAKIFDGGTTQEGLPFFVMELVQGIPFNRYCDSNKLNILDRLQLFMPICRAIQHAHQKGIIHRDLKPSNILVAVIDGFATPKVIDFGLAKALQHQTKLTDKTLFTEYGQVVGTLQYMSPEQAEMNALDVDTRTDVYSLGVILYELLTGSTPIESDALRNRSIFQVLETIREKDPPRPSVRMSDFGEKATDIGHQRQIEAKKLTTLLRGDLDWIVMKALEKDRARRYSSASAMLDDINRFLSGDAIEARPPSTKYRLQKLVRKHKGLVAGLAAVVTMLLVGIVGTTYGLWRAEVAWKSEKDQRLIAEQRTAEVLEAQERVQQEWNRAQQAERIVEEKFFAKALKLTSENPTDGNFFTFTNFFAEKKLHDKVLQLFDQFLASSDDIMSDESLNVRWNKSIYLAEIGRFGDAFKHSRPIDGISDEWCARFEMDHGICGLFSNDAAARTESLNSFIKAGQLGTHAYWEIAVRPVLLNLSDSEARLLFPHIETWCKAQRQLDDVNWILACGEAAAGRPEQALLNFEKGILADGTLKDDNSRYNLRLDAWNHYFYAKALNDSGQREKAINTVRQGLNLLQLHHPDDGQNSLAIHWIPRHSIGPLKKACQAINKGPT